ncbi:MAG: hypothetical protein ACJ74U_10435 [Jatrophihabitantaceae bacterium]
MRTAQRWPRGRGKIERFFGSVNELCLPGLPGHLVRGFPASAPKLQAARTRRRRELRGEITVRRTPGPGTPGSPPARLSTPPAEGPRPRLKRYANA